MLQVYQPWQQRITNGERCSYNSATFFTIFLLISVLLAPVLIRRNASSFSKHGTEIMLALVSDLFGDVRDRQIACMQKLGCFSSRVWVSS